MSRFESCVDNLLRLSDETPELDDKLDDEDELLEDELPPKIDPEPGLETRGFEGVSRKEKKSPVDFAGDDGELRPAPILKVLLGLEGVEISDDAEKPDEPDETELASESLLILINPSLSVGTPTLPRGILIMPRLCRSRTSIIFFFLKSIIVLDILDL